MIFSQDSKPNVAQILEKILNEKSIEEAQQTFEKIISDSTQYVLLENELNALGYQLARQRKFNEAIAVC